MNRLPLAPDRLRPAVDLRALLPIAVYQGRVLAPTTLVARFLDFEQADMFVSMLLEIAPEELFTVVSERTVQ